MNRYDETVQSLQRVLHELPPRWAHELCLEIYDKASGEHDMAAPDLYVPITVTAVTEHSSLTIGALIRCTHMTLRSDLGKSQWYGTIECSHTEGKINILYDEREDMEEGNDCTVRLSVYLGELAMSLEDYLELAEGSELTFSMSNEQSVYLCFGRLPVATAALTLSADGIYLKIKEIYGKRIRGRGN